MPKGWVLFYSPFSGVILSPFLLLSFIFYLKPLHVRALFFWNKLLDKPSSCVETETRWETRDWGRGGCRLLFQGEGVCLKVGNSREVRDENGNSRGCLLDRGATFISYNWLKRCAFCPFFCIILCASFSRPTFPCTLHLPTNKRLGTSLLHCLVYGHLATRKTYHQPPRRHRKPTTLS